MFINITDSETGSNKGSCNALVEYLEKESPEEKEYWFNGMSAGNAMQISPQLVRVNIDHNVAKLGKDDAKFFLINISPSEKEIPWLKEKFGDQGAEEQLKAYAVKVMDAYAENFKRTGITCNTDLLWYGKLERNRYYRSGDPEVKQGLVKQGEPKPGEQMHVQVIVSRKDITNTIKLSPMNNSRGKNRAHSEKLGQFDRKAFKGSGEKIFDQLFGYDRTVKETMDYALTMKGGSAEEKKSLYQLSQKEVSRSAPSNGSFNPARENQGVNAVQSELKDLITELGFGTSSIISDLLPGINGYDSETDQVPNLKKKKKPRRRLQ